MVFELKKFTFVTWAAIGVPLLFSAYVQWSYSYSLGKGGLPYNTLPGWLWYLVFWASLASGVVAVIATKPKNCWAHYLAPILYAVIMVVTLMWLHMYVACGNGDCI